MIDIQLRSEVIKSKTHHLPAWNWVLENDIEILGEIFFKSENKFNLSESKKYLKKYLKSFGK